MPPLKAKFRLTLFQIETNFVYASFGFLPDIRTGSVWLATQHWVEQPLSAAASNFFTGSRRGKCHGKNSHFQEFIAGHQVEYYRHSTLAIVGVITPIAFTTKRSPMKPQLREKQAIA